MKEAQPGILAPLPRLARYLTFRLCQDFDLTAALEIVSNLPLGDSVIGLGQALIPQGEDDMRTFPPHAREGIRVPSTPADLWVWLRGSDRGELLHKGRELEAFLAESFVLDNVIDGFQYRDSRDLSGYIDGTENPVEDAAVEAALSRSSVPGLMGSSFVAVQQWVHDLDHFKSLSVPEQDDVFGRRISDNEEFEEAPLSAHVKRTAQEDFSPEAFIVRRSMPWAEAKDQGLVFVAFGHSFDPFEVLLQRMVGHDDGTVDGLFRFSRPITGSYFWCPPVSAGKLDLQALQS